jgi:hypothetical protein
VSDVRNGIPPPVPPFEPGPRTAGMYRTSRAAWKYLGLAVLCGVILWASTLAVYLIFAGKAH